MTHSKQIVRELDKFSIKREDNITGLAFVILAIVFGLAIGLSI